MSAGRFAPSPTGRLHVGNLRTAVLAWLFAKQTGRDFIIRIEDLDTARARDPEIQLHELAQLGIVPDHPCEKQSEHTERYQAVLDELAARGMVYECYCSRREILDSVNAAHGVPGEYSGTCRDLSDAEREQKRAELAAAGRDPALRLRSSVASLTVSDFYAGQYEGAVDDMVLRRSDGSFAYNLAVVIDDNAQGIDQVVRGDDLLPSTPRQAYLYDLLELPRPEWVHVPIVLNSTGQRLAKRDGAVTLEDLAKHGVAATAMLADIAQSIGLAERSAESFDYDADKMLQWTLHEFDPQKLPREPWIYR